MARSVVVTALVLAVALYAGLYLLLSVPAVQNKIKQRGEKELSDLLGTRVSITRVDIEPFNELTLHGVNVPDQQGDSLLAVDKLGAGVSLYELLVNRKLVFTYGEIIGLRGHITRPDKDSPTNLQFIIDAFAPKPNQPPKPYDLQIKNIVLRKSLLTYDVLSEPRRPGRFDANHITLRNLRADLELPRIKNNDFDIDLKRLSFDEQSGFELKNLTAHALVTDTLLRVSNLRVELPRSAVYPQDVELRYASLKTMGQDLRSAPLKVSVANSYITPADLRAFVPALAPLEEPVHITLAAEGNKERLRLPVLSLSTRDKQLALDVNGTFTHLDDAVALTASVPYVHLEARGGALQHLLSQLPAVTPQARRIVTACGDIGVDGSVDGSPARLLFTGNVDTSLGSVKIAHGAFESQHGTHHLAGEVSTAGVNLGRLLDKENLLGQLAVDASVDATLAAGKVGGTFDGTVHHIDFKNYRYHNITAHIQAQGQKIAGQLHVDDPNGNIDAAGEALLAGAASQWDVDLKAGGVNLATLLQRPVPVHAVNTLTAQASLRGNSLETLQGTLQVDRVSLTGKDHRVWEMDDVSLSAEPQRVTLSSPVLNGYIDGAYNLKTLAPAVQNLVAEALPSLVPRRAAQEGGNDFDFHFTVEPDEWLNDIINAPVRLIYRVDIDGSIDERTGAMSAVVNAPYLQQGANKLIEGTRLTLDKAAGDNAVKVALGTIFPTKNGKVSVTLDAAAQDDRVDANAGWRVARDRDFHGDLNLTALLSRDMDRKLAANVQLHPTQLVFNDTAWTVEQGIVDYRGGHIHVDNLVAHCDKQFVRIDGDLSHDPDDELMVSLGDINLEYIFNTLNINHVTFGGRATGNFTVADVFSKAPRLMTPNLHVDNMKYNGALMGDGDIESHWDPATMAVVINCDLSQRNSEHTFIHGEIFPAADSLYMTFDANHANVEFMKPFMAGFTSDVRGEVSGHAVLAGNFKTIDLAGDVIAHDLQMKINYTNCTYTCSDTVHIVPGHIAFDNVKLRDRDGHEALLNGFLDHNAFHDPVFNFTITDARNFLCYDIPETMNADWYGTIYGNGSAIVSGEPGFVKISVNMQSAERSKFTFVLSDTKEASEYNFITFRDRDRLRPDGTVAPAAEEEVDTVPQIVRLLTQRIEQQNQSDPTLYNIDLRADITPEAQIVLVMDPVSGDRIRANGNGNMRLNYSNIDDKFEMFGRYVLTRGNYNFTLQDIIIKDFTIREGSTISFDGDPYSASLDIQAVYALNANIRDLDESFATDRDINRTNVPVHALLHVTGDIAQPELGFDLEFPTLTAEAHRKVKSVISTDDMMNRQIIYLLALNRFYTPDYMNSTSRNNEWTSVASSTISSQLSSMLGQLSENWSISPNFRSDRGDFSDMEVDVALSSQLLNNRLLINGNLGYRDNTLNPRNSNFIGDFDLEYLLNRRGSIRLKAYNHFNDQSIYYVRNAMTTQGVGIVFKHDFDRLFKSRRRDTVPAAAPPDSVAPRVSTGSSGSSGSSGTSGFSD